jgi:hypothetical protein
MLPALCLTAVVIVALVRAPLATLAAVTLTGAALSVGLISPPAALADPIAKLRADVESWQDERAARLTCHLRAVQALTSEDEQQLAAAEEVCARVD